MKKALTAAALVCLSTQVSSRPSITALSEDSLPPEACRVYSIDPSSEQRLLVLYWSASTAEMQIDRRRVVVTVTEAPCLRNCVAPGKRGIRQFYFQGDGIRACLQKAISCSRDAESCSGLPKGSAELHVSSKFGTTRLRVHNVYCDL